MPPVRPRPSARSWLRFVLTAIQDLISGQAASLEAAQSSLHFSLIMAGRRVSASLFLFEVFSIMDRNIFASQLAKEMSEITGDNFIARQKPDYDHGIYVIMFPDEKANGKKDPFDYNSFPSMFISDAWRERGKVSISGIYPRFAGSEFPYSASQRVPSIKVGIDRRPEVAAKDVIKRFWSDYHSLWLTSVAKGKQYLADIMKANSNAKKIASVLSVETDEVNRSYNMPITDRDISEKGNKFSGYIVKNGDDNYRCRIEGSSNSSGESSISVYGISVELAVKIFKLMASEGYRARQ